MASPVVIYRGQTINGSCELRLIDTLIKGLMSAYTIPAGALVEMLWPGASGTVILSTANVGEITISDANRAKFSFKMSSDKSLLLAIDPENAGYSATVDVRVTDTSFPANVDIFEKQKVYVIFDKANAG